jgi:hypothetical protein
MHRALATAILGFGVFISGTAHAERGIFLTRNGHDLTIVVRGVTDYCATDASIEVIRREDTIRIIRDRPTRVSRCMAAQDVTVVVKDVPAGRYRVTYEQIPYLAPARALTIASTTAIISD